MVATAYDLVMFKPASAPGTGNITPGTTVAGHRPYTDIANGATVSYGIEDQGEKETGYGVYNSAGPTITRNTVKSSTGSTLNLSANAIIFIDITARDINALLPADGSGAMTGALLVTTGSVSAPGVAISGDANTGVYSPGADQIRVATGGVAAFAVDSSQRCAVGSNLAPSSSAQLLIQTASASRTGLIVKAAASQSANIFDVQTSGGGSRFAIGPTGVIGANGNAPDATIGLNLGGSGERLDSAGNPYAAVFYCINALAGNVNGVYAYAESRYAGAIGTMIALAGQCVSNNAANAVTTMRALQAMSPVATSSAGVTTAYGLYIATQKATGVTTGYGAYQVNSGDLNYFAGPSGFQDTPDANCAAVFGAPVRHKSYTVATLPTTAPAYSVAAVSDASAVPAKGATVAGGGSTKALVMYDSANWVGI